MEYVTIITRQKFNNPPPNLMTYVKWEKPRRRALKVNVDGAMKNIPGSGGFGGMFRDQDGTWHLGYFRAEPLTTPIEMELKSLWRGLQLAIRHNVRILQIQTNAQEVIDMIKSGNLLYTNIISECRSSLHKLEPWEMRHVSKEQNRLVDTMAKEGLMLGYFDDISVFVTPPIFVHSQLNADILGTI